MSNARDKANIPALNFSSTGIDDNATSTAVTIDSSENVGIGTTSPSRLLHLNTTGSGTNTYLQLTSDATGTGTLDGFQIIVAGSDGSTILTQRENSSLQFTTNNTERMRITSAGNVGIGTTSPNTKLDVVGTGVNGIELGQQSDNTGNSSRLFFNNSTNIWTAYSTTGNFKIASGATIGSASGTDRLVIDSSGRVGIGTSSPSSISNLHVADAYASEPMIRIETSDSGNKRLDLYVSGGHGYVTARQSAQNLNLDARSNLIFNSGSSAGTERMRIDSSGNVFISKTTDDFSVAGTMITNAGGIKQTVNSNVIQQLNRLGDDGGLIKFYQAGGEEGNISVSGATVSYNGFTGTHWSRFTDNSTPTILRGTVLESLDEMCDWYNLEFDVTTQDKDGNDVTTTEKVPHVLADGQSEGDIITYNYNGTDYQATIVKEKDIKHMMSKVSDTTDAKNVYGVFNSWDKDGEGYNDFFVASVGSFVVRIKQGETVAKGDLLQSNGDGTAKVQTDDAVRSSSFAKVLSTTIIETYEDGSYLVPCSLMC